jgi:acetyl-CoA carboxylase biotin carboxyl carrier protein
MGFDPDFIDRLIRLVDESRIAELDYSDESKRIRIVKAPGGRAKVAADDIPNSAGHAVVAGIVGTFFRAAAPGEAAFVSVGAVVKEGQTLGIIEAMKVMNPVEADRAGKIAEIVVEDGAAVAPGTPLFVIADDV